MSNHRDSGSILDGKYEILERLATGGMGEEIPHETLAEAFKTPEQKKEPTLRTPDGRRVTKWLPSRSAPKGPR